MRQSHIYVVSVSYLCSFILNTPFNFMAPLNTNRTFTVMKQIHTTIFGLNRKPVHRQPIMFAKPPTEHFLKVNL